MRERCSGVGNLGKRSRRRSSLINSMLTLTRRICVLAVQPLCSGEIRALACGLTSPCRHWNWRAGHFRGLIAAASLKRPRTTACAARSPSFPRLNCRGLIEAHVEGLGRWRCGLHFRGLIAAASLKLCLSGGKQAKSLSFPRLNCRGLIEAGRSFRRRSRPRKFPRLNCRGLIEASEAEIDRSVAAAFPRLNCRGLIEAQRASQPLERMWRFPRLNCRGLIEASGRPRPLGRRLDFRGLIAAASLKRFPDGNVGDSGCISAA